MKKQGKKTDRISVFIETRSKRNGSISDLESEEIIVRKKKNQLFSYYFILR